MGVLQDRPRCAEHRSPIVETYMSPGEMQVYQARFAYQHGNKLPDPTRTRIVWLRLAHPDVVRFQEWLKQERGNRGKVDQQSAMPLIVEVVKDEEYDKLLTNMPKMGSAYDD